MQKNCAHSVIWSAFRAGKLSAFILRRSSRSRSGLVIAATFSQFANASSFARFWSVKSGLSVKVRRSACGGFTVSVPVSWSSSRLPRCFAFRLPVAGLGVRGFAQLVRGSGLVSGAM